MLLPSHPPSILLHLLHPPPSTLECPSFTIRRHPLASPSTLNSMISTQAFLLASNFSIDEGDKVGFVVSGDTVGSERRDVSARAVRTSRVRRRHRRGRRPAPRRVQTCALLTPCAPDCIIVCHAQLCSSRLLLTVHCPFSPSVTVALHAQLYNLHSLLNVMYRTPSLLAVKSPLTAKCRFSLELEV